MAFAACLAGVSDILVLLSAERVIAALSVSSLGFLATLALWDGVAVYIELFLMV